MVDSAVKQAEGGGAAGASPGRGGRGYAEYAAGQGGGVPSTEAEARWWVLHTRSHQEKAVADTCAAQRINFFLPMLTHVRVYDHRKIHVEMPMFPGYVFLHASVDETYEADRTHRVAKIIRVDDQARLEWELANIRKALSCSAPLNPYPYLRVGIRAEVRSGPLKGLQGMIESRTQANRLLLQVDLLGRALSVEVDGLQLDPLE